MRAAGDSKMFITAAAMAMAGLVIATMLTINAKLQNALTPPTGSGGTPATKVVQSVSAPEKLRVVATPSVAPPPPAASPPQATQQLAAPASNVAAPKPVTAAKAAARKVPAAPVVIPKVDVKVPSVPVPAVTVPAVVPNVAPVTTTVPVSTPTLPAPTTALPTGAAGSDIGDSAANSGLRSGGKNKATPTGLVATTSVKPDAKSSDPGHDKSGGSAPADKDDDD